MFDPLPANLQDAIDALQSLPGWCPVDKARMMAALILREKPGTVVEIGVFGGRSLFPQAMALKHNGRGSIHAIDAWNNAVAEEYDALEGEHKWWKTLDLEAVFQGFLSEMQRLKLSEHVHVIRKSSQEAISQYADDTVDILHQDGNHSTIVSCREIDQWLPKLRCGGWLWMDDVNWPSVQEAFEKAQTLCELVHNSGWWALFRKR